MLVYFWNNFSHKCCKIQNAHTCFHFQMQSTTAGEHARNELGNTVSTRDFRTVVMAQLVEQLLLTPEICSSNYDISKILSTNCTIKNRKDENKEKECRNGPSFKKSTKDLENR